MLFDKCALDREYRGIYNQLTVHGEEVIITENRQTILHSDMNSFYASVEMMLNPDLKGKAIAVCGSTEDRHGIVLAKSEKAKKYGVKTGMVNFEARQRCPELILVPPQYDQYLKYSKLAHEIYYRYTDQVEPFGMDECWLDVTHSVVGSGLAIAEEIRQAVREELGLTVSIGVSFNKIFAKLGSDMKKPDEHTLIQALNESNIIRSRARVITTSNGLHKIPVVASHGNAAWMEEEDAYTESDEAFSQVNLDAHKVGTLIKVSEELLQDSAFDLESYIRSEFSRRIGDKEEDAFLNGNGTHKPTGILNATGGAQVGVTTASATAITADEIIDLFYSLKAPYRKNAVWILNDATVKAIRKLKNGTGDYLWQPAIKDGEVPTILGRPYFTSQYAPTIEAAAKVIAFGDFSYYWIGDRQGISFKRLNELYAGNGQVGFLASKRLDGKLVLPEAIKVLQMKA